MNRGQVTGLGFLLLVAAPADAHIGPYTVTELGDLPGSWSSVPTRMNNAGQVVGWGNFSASQGGGVRAFLWTPGAGTVQIGPAGMTNTRALDITDSGLVLGIGYQSPAFVGWIFDGANYELLPPFPGGSTACSTSNFTVAAMNGSREVVGSVCVGTNLQFHAFYYSPWAGYIDLKNQFGVASTLAISEGGVIAGSAFGQAYRLTFTGGLELLGSLPDPFDDGAAATAINEGGMTIGFSTRFFTGGSIWYRSFRHDGAMEEIAPTIFERSTPWGINARGHVVGNIGPNSSPDRDPWLWTPATGKVDLTFPPGTGPEWVRFTAARAINDRGQILMHAWSADATITSARAVVLTPRCTTDFNGDGVYPDTLDLLDFLNVFGGGACSNDPQCDDVDFNGDGVSPDATDLFLFLNVFAGGAC